MFGTEKPTVYFTVEKTQGISALKTLLWWVSQLQTMPLTLLSKVPIQSYYCLASMPQWGGPAN